MTRSSGADGGFAARSAPAASKYLTNAVAMMLAAASVSVCLIMAMTVLSARIAMAMPLPA